MAGPTEPGQQDERAHSSAVPVGDSTLPAVAGEATVADAIAAAMAAARQRPSHQKPDQIGPYRILEKIGEGGMGVVYKAEQKQPVRRLVALKVIKLGMDTREVIARFEVERQALALMSHPNVAKVYEAGTTARGRPYFAMEFVAGMPLTRYCDESRLTTRERLQLFIQVCNAVQHAHQKGIIHRDLKPSNILVTHFDGKPVPKVIDFGIAKAANQALTERTLYTRTGSLIGTPEYMSPEQALTSGLDVDTRTDIYSLGVILYELLTGTLPLDSATLHQASPERMAQIIKTAEPPKPSTRLGMLASGGGSAGGTPAADSHDSSSTRLTEIASLRRCDPRSLRRELRGDLDWIVLKAIEKDRTRRYETANGLANDLRRHLDREPISARPPTTHYKMAKFVSKHRIGVAAAGAVVAALGLGLALAIYGLVQARHERDAARRAEQSEATQRRDAEQATKESNETSRIMGGLFSGDAPNQFKLAARRLDKEHWLAGQPDVQAALRITLGTAGAADMAHIKPEETKGQLQAALSLARDLAEPQRSQVAGAANYLLGVVNEAENHTDDAERAYLDARTAYRTLDTATWYSIDTKTRLATISADKHDRARASAFMFEALQERVRYEQTRVDLSNDWDVHKDQGVALARVGRFRAALLEFDRAVKLKPTEQTPWYLRTCVLAYLNDVKPYQVNCNGMVDQFVKGTTFKLIQRNLIACLLLPDSGVNRKELGEMNALQRQLATPPMESWANLASGMLCYRLGDYEGCREAMRLCKQVPYRSRDETAELFIAMAYDRLGDHDLAATTFASVARSIEGEFQQAGKADVAENGEINVEDWLVLQVIYHEARQMFRGPAPAPAATRPSP